MAANGLINGFERDLGGDPSFMQGIPPGENIFPNTAMPGIPQSGTTGWYTQPSVSVEEHRMGIPAPLGQGNMPATEEQRMGMPAPLGGGVDEIGQAFRNYLTQNPHADRDAPNIDTYDAFKAGVEFGSGPLFTPTPPPVVEEFGTPYVAPNVDEFEGFAKEGTPGFDDPQGQYRQQPPSSFSLDPNDPRNEYLNQGVPAVIQTPPIDVSDIGRPRG